MRVLIVHNRYQNWGGEDVVVESEHRLLKSHGHEVECEFFDNRLINSRFGKFLAAIGMPFNVASARRLRRRIAAFQPHIIHIHNFHLLASPSIFFAAHSAVVPVVHTLHNFRLICPSGTLLFKNRIYEKSLQTLFPVDAILKGVYRNSKVETAAVATVNTLHNLLGTWEKKVNAFIVLSAFAAGKFRESSLRVSPDKFRVKPNFAADHGVGFGPRHDFFLFAGRLSEEKGIEMLLQAASQYGFPLTIIGDGPMKPLVLNYQKTCSNIRYRGFLPKPEVIDHLKRCTALIFPSICYEGFGLSIIEAFSTGTAVISSRLGVHCELIEDGVNGLLFEPNDPHDLFRRIVQIRGDIALQSRLGTNGRRSFESRYTAEINYKMLMGIYERTIDDFNHR